MMKYLTKFFKKKEKEPKPIRDQVYDIISKHLSDRKNVLYESKEVKNRPHYVVEMCKEILSHMPNTVTLKDILMKDDLASGHVDYHSKLSLYCADLYKEHSK